MGNNVEFIKILFLFLLIFLGAIIFAVTKGSVNIPLHELLSVENQSIIYVRLLRILLAIVAGSGLSVCGIVLQAILRNPLADPYLLGTSSGAGLGAVLAVVLGLSGFYMPLVAFAAAILTVGLVYFIARENGAINPHSLILSGVIASIALSGIMVFAVSVSPNEALYGLMWWLWGSLEVYDLKLLFIVSGIVFAGIAVIYVFAQDLNAISLGEEKAIHLGINVEWVKKIMIVLTSLITASLVCVCGVIGFVGLIIPHLVRIVGGADHKRLLPLSILGASSFLIICDTLGRVIFSPVQIPIGVVTAIIGAPIFIILFKNRQSLR
jgi:iron complex transport system permease protein